MPSSDRSAGPGPLEQWARMLRLRWRAGVAVFLFVVALGAAVVFLSRPIYRAEARLRLGEPPPMTGVSPTTGLIGLFRAGGDPFANDLELLGSRTVAEGVVEEAALHVKLHAPRGWPRDSLFRFLAAGRQTGRAVFAAAWDEVGGVTVRQMAPAESLVGTARAGESIAFGGVTAAFRPWRPGMPRSIKIATDSFAKTVRLSRPRFVAERARRDANVVDISFTHRDPGVVRVAVAAVVERFQALRTAIQRRESGQTVDSLRTVAAQTRADLTRAEAALEELQRRSRFIAPDEQKDAFVQRLSETAQKLAEGEIELTALDRLLRRAADALDSGVAWAELASFPRFLENTTIGAVLSQLTARYQQRTELATRRREDNREMRVLDAQIVLLDSTLRSLVYGYRDALAQETGQLRARLAEMDAEFAAVPRTATELGRRTRDVRLLSDAVVLTEQRLRQEELREALTFANVQVIDPPALRDKPIWPRKGTGLVVAVLLGGLFGVVAMVTQQRADRAVRTAREIQAALGAPVLLGLERTVNGGLPATHDDLGSLVRSAAPADRPAPHLAVAGARDGPAAGEVAGALVAAGAFARDGGARPDGAPTLTVGEAIDRFPTAARAATAGAPVVIVVECGRTTAEELERAAALLAESGAPLAGAIAVCADARSLRELWR